MTTTKTAPTLAELDRMHAEATAAMLRADHAAAVARHVHGKPAEAIRLHAEASGHAARVREIERLLIEAIANAASPGDELMYDLVHAFFADPGEERINDD